MREDLNARPETIKLLEENIGRTLFDISCSNIFLDLSLQAKKGNKSKNKQGNLTKLKSICTAKGTINKMKRQYTEWEKISANDMTDKGLISKIYKQFIQLNKNKKKHTHKKQITWLKNGQKTQTGIFPKKTYRWPIGTWKDAQHH